MNAMVAWSLPVSTPSLAAAAPEAPNGTIFVLSAYGGYAVTPRRFKLFFGREREDVHVVIGADDPHVSRLHGLLARQGNEWWMRNTGRLPIRLPGGRLLLSEHEMPVPNGYLPVLIGQPRGREHLLEIRVASPAAEVGPIGPGRSTKAPTMYELTDIERLVMVSLAQRYLRNETYPQPVSWKQVADDMSRLMPDMPWIPRSAANVVTKVRERLSHGKYPIPGLLADDVGQPLGNALNHNLILAFLESTTLLPEDLALLGDED